MTQIKIKALLGLVVVLVSIFCITKIKKRDRKKALLLFASSLLLILPFSPLSNHINNIYLKGTLWALVPSALLFGVLVKGLFDAYNQLFARFLIIGGAIFVLSISFVQNRHTSKLERTFISATIRNQNSFTDEVSERIKNQDCKRSIWVEGTNSSSNIYASIFDSEHLNFYTIPALLSYSFPDHEFFIPKNAIETNRDLWEFLLKMVDIGMFIKAEYIPSSGINLANPTLSKILLPILTAALKLLGSIGFCEN